MVDKTLICIDNCDDWFNIGSEYYVNRDGIVIDELGDEHDFSFKTLEQINDPDSSPLTYATFKIKEKSLKEIYLKLAKEKLLVFEDSDGERYILSGDLLISVSRAFKEENVDDDLRYTLDKSNTFYDFNKIYDFKYEKFEALWTSFDKIIKSVNLKLIWQRKKEMTLEDIKKELGYDFELVESSD